VVRVRGSFLSIRGGQVRMASKRFTKSVIDWAKIAERVPENQKPQFLALKARSDNYLRR
jgi:hypothetical protein